MTDRKNIIAPSLLSANFSAIAAAVKCIESAGADWIHLDVMDGNFVPPITFGAQMIGAIRQETNMPLDAHLMALDPEKQLEVFIEAGVNRFTFHVEVEIHAHRLIGEIKKQGAKAGIAIVPSTPVSSIVALLGIVDQVLVMTVNPGWGGQSMIMSTLEKVKQLRLLKEEGAGEYLICIDGGFSQQTASVAWKAGIDMAVMGSAFFNADNPAEVLEDCRRLSG